MSEGVNVSACERAGYARASRTAGGVRGKAGTPGFWAPEMLGLDADGRGARYGPAVDLWSLGCTLYALATSRGPFTKPGGDTNDDNAATLHAEPALEGRGFSGSFAALLAGLLQKDPAKRLGCGAAGAAELLGHPFFEGTDWPALLKKEARPPFQPSLNVLETARTVRPWGERDRARMAATQLTPGDQERFKGIPYCSHTSVVKELVQNLALCDFSRTGRLPPAAPSRAPPEDAPPPHAHAPPPLLSKARAGEGAPQPPPLGASLPRGGAPGGAAALRAASAAVAEKGKGERGGGASAGAIKRDAVKACAIM
jgi:serine/threonine protein kinase